MYDLLVDTGCYRVNCRFSGKNSQNKRKIAKKIIHFTMQFRSKNLTHFANLKSLSIIKNILPNASEILTHFTNFPVNMFVIGVTKNICTAQFLDAQKMHSRRT